MCEVWVASPACRAPQQRPGELFDLYPEIGNTGVVKTSAVTDRALEPLAGLDRDAGVAPDRAEGRTRAAIVDLLLADGPLTTAELAQQLGALSPTTDKSTADELLASLKREIARLMKELNVFSGATSES